MIAIRLAIRFTIAACCLGIAGCSTAGYYIQAARGHLALHSSERPIAEVIADPGTPARVATELRRVEQVRDFAVAELALPDNGSYRSYARLDRDYVVYSVVAAPELSLTPVNSCFPIAGCVTYRGYYRLEDAARERRRLVARGLDVYVAPVPAYSTLGWFDDPVPSSLLGRSHWSLAGTLFHELAHQRLYIADDTAFNEAYASAVERVGVARWLSVHGTEADRRAHARDDERRQAFLALVRAARERLEAAYALEAPRETRLALKREELTRLRAEYADLRTRWGGYRGYDRWFAQDLNNAKLALVATYNDLVPAFVRLVERVDGRMDRFHAVVECIAARDAEERRVVLEQLTSAQSAVGRGSGSQSSPCSSIAG